MTKKQNSQMKGSRPDAAFPRSARLLVSRQFDRVHKNGRRLYTADFVVIVCKEVLPLSKRSIAAKQEFQPTQSRLGITVSKKVDKRAVRRNYIKRSVREFFRTIRAELASPIDLVIVAKPSCSGQNSIGIAEQLRHCLRSKGLLQSSSSS